MQLDDTREKILPIYTTRASKTKAAFTIETNLFKNDFNTGRILKIMTYYALFIEAQLRWVRSLNGFEAQ